MKRIRGYSSWVMVTIVLALLAAACTSSSSAKKPKIEGNGADLIQAGKDTTAIPVGLYLPQPSDIYEREWLLGYSYFDLCDLGLGWESGSRTTSGFWINDPDLGPDFEELDYFFFVSEWFEDAEAVFAQRVENLRGCDDFNKPTDEVRDSVSGAQLKELEELAGLGSQAVRADAVFGVGWLLAYGEVVMVRDGNVLITGGVGQFTRDMEAFTGVEVDDAEEDQWRIPATAPTTGATDVLRTVFDRLENRFASSLDVLEVHRQENAFGTTIYLVVQNSSDKAMLAAPILVGGGRQFGPVLQPIPPGEKALLAIGWSLPFDPELTENPIPEDGYKVTVMGVELDAPTFTLDVLEQPTIGGTYKVMAEGTFSSTSLEVALLFRNDEDFIVDVVWVPLDLIRREDAPSIAAEAEGEVPDVPGATSVEIIRFA